MDSMKIWEFLAGLGIFLFGIFLMEEAIKNLSGKAFKKIIRHYTEGRLKSILAGTFATAILQSSSAVSLMVLAFVGAGIMNMTNAIGVILGSNIGTTLTSWIVATVGFKIKIEVLALPFVGIGGLGLIFFGRSNKGINASRLLVGFGFLFMGLDYMKRAIEFLSSGVNLSDIPNYAMIYVLAGFLITAVVQASSATMAIILSGISSGIITFDIGAAMIIGTNLGTTMTVLLGSIGGVVIKRRVAYSHFFFNFFTGVITFLLLPLLTNLINVVFHLKNDPLIGLALFHTIFNILGVIIFAPIINLFVKFIIKIAPEENKHVTKYLHQFSEKLPDVPDAGVTAVRKESLHLINRVLLYNISLVKIDTSGVLIQKKGITKQEKPGEDLYTTIKQIQAEIFSFAARLQSIQLSGKEGQELLQMLPAVRFAVASAKTLKDISHNIDELDGADHEVLNSQYKELQEKMTSSSILISEMLEDDNNKNENCQIISRLQTKLVYEDEIFIANLTDAINQKKIQDLEISLLIAVNRGYIISNKQLMASINELKLHINLYPEIEI